MHCDIFYLPEDTVALLKKSYFFIVKLMDVNY